MTLQPNSSTAEPSLSIDTPALAPICAPDVEQGDPAATEWRKEFEFPGVLALVPGHRERVMEFVSQHCPDEEKQIDP